MPLEMSKEPLAPPTFSRRPRRVTEPKGGSRYEPGGRKGAWHMKGIPVKGVWHGGGVVLTLYSDVTVVGVAFRRAGDGEIAF